MCELGNWTTARQLEHNLLEALQSFGLNCRAEFREMFFVVFMADMG